MGTVMKAVGLTFVGLVVLGAVSGRQTQSAAEPSVPDSALARYPASDIALSYSRNSVGADQEFKDRRFQVWGTVESINTNVFGTPYVVMAGGPNMFSNPQFQFSGSQTSQLAKLWKGASVTLVCTGNGDVVKTAMMKDCRFL